MKKINSGTYKMERNGCEVRVYKSDSDIWCFSVEKGNRFESGNPEIENTKREAKEIAMWIADHIDCDSIPAMPF